MRTAPGLAERLRISVDVYVGVWVLDDLFNIFLAWDFTSNLNAHASGRSVCSESPSGLETTRGEASKTTRAAERLRYRARVCRRRMPRRVGRHIESRNGCGCMSAPLKDASASGPRGKLWNLQEVQWHLPGATSTGVCAWATMHSVSKPKEVADVPEGTQECFEDTQGYTWLVRASCRPPSTRTFSIEAFRDGRAHWSKVRSRWPK